MMHWPIEVPPHVGATLCRTVRNEPGEYEQFRRLPETAHATSL
jgi:hypothetical protein